MNALRMVLALLLLFGTMAGTASGDIYVWTDENGVKHITNYEPPPQAELLIRTPEIEYDAEEDRLRREADERARLAHERRELEQREAQLAARQREAERLIEATERLADELRQSRAQQQAGLDEDDGRTVILHNRKFFSNRGHRPDFFRKNGSIFYTAPPHRRHDRHLKDTRGRSPHARTDRRRGAFEDKDPHGSVTGPRSPRESARYPGSPYFYERRY